MSGLLAASPFALAAALLWLLHVELLRRRTRRAFLRVVGRNRILRRSVAELGTENDRLRLIMGIAARPAPPGSEQAVRDHLRAAFAHSIPAGMRARASVTLSLAEDRSVSFGVEYPAASPGA